MSFLLAGCGQSAAPGADGGPVVDAADSGAGAADVASADAGAGDASPAPPADAGAGGGGEGACPVVDFQPCGGVVVGVWDILDWCPDDPVLAASYCEHPFDDRPQCVGGGNGQTCDTRTYGTLRFGDDGVLEMFRSSVTRLRYTFDEPCLAVAYRDGPSAVDACARLGDNPRLSCAFEGGICTCEGTLAEEDVSDVPPEPVVVDYRLSAADVIEFSVEGRPRFEAAYCVDGDRLVLDVTPHEDTWRYWVLERAPAETP